MWYYDEAPWVPSPTWGIAGNAPGGNGPVTGSSSGGGKFSATPAAPACDNACQWGKVEKSTIDIGSVVLGVGLLVPSVIEAVSIGDPEGLETDGEDIGSSWSNVVEDFANCGEGLSFASATLVATETGEQPIDSLKPGKTSRHTIPPPSRASLKSFDMSGSIMMMISLISPSQRRSRQARAHQPIRAVRPYIPTGITDSESFNPSLFICL